MMKKNTTRELKSVIAINGIQALGHGMGLYLTRPTIKKTVNKNMQLVDGLMRAAFSPRDTPHKRNKRVIEFAGIGAIAVYTFFNGIERKKKSLIIQGAFLGATLFAVGLVSTSWINQSNKKID